MTNTPNTLEHPAHFDLVFGKNQKIRVVLDWLGNSRYNAWVMGACPKGLYGARLGALVSKRLGELDTCGIEPEFVYQARHQQVRELY